MGWSPFISHQMTLDIYSHSSLTSAVTSYWLEIIGTKFVIHKFTMGSSLGFLIISLCLKVKSGWREEKSISILKHKFSFWVTSANTCQIPYSDLSLCRSLSQSLLICLSSSRPSSPYREQSNSHCFSTESSVQSKPLANITYLYFALGPNHLSCLAGEAETPPYSFILRLQRFIAHYKLFIVERCFYL